MTRREKAEGYFLDGYNCAQAIVLAFDGVVDIDKDTLARLASPFGGGMGRMREVCGAVSGMYILLGLLEGYSTPETGDVKMQLYKKVQDLASEFKDKNGAIVCRDLIGAKKEIMSAVPSPRTPEYYKSRPCAKLIGDVAEIFEDHLKETGIIL